MKRFLLILMAFLIAAMLATACNKDASSKPTEELDPDAAVTIKVGIWAKDSDAAGLQAWENYKNVMAENYPNITMVPEPYSYSADTFIPMAVSGTAPNIFLCPFTEPNRLITNNFVADVTSFAERYGFKDGMVKEMLEVGMMDGKIYGIPRGGYALSLFINMDLFKQAGLVDSEGLPIYPKTFDELAETAKTIKQKTGKSGFALPSRDRQGGWQFSNIAWNFGAKLQYQDDSGKWKNGLNSDGAVAALQFYKKLKWDYDVLPADSLINYEKLYQLFGTGEVGMIIAGSDSFSRPVSSYGMNKDSIAVAPIPAGPGGQYSLLGGNMFMFSHNSTPNQLEACFKLLKVIGMTPDVNDDMLKSIEEDILVRLQNNIPVGPQSLNVWSNSERVNAEQKIYDKYTNVNMKLFQPFYDVVNKTLKAEEPYYCQDMYSALDNAIQECLTNKDADPKAQLDKAAKDFQQFLDQV